METSTTITKESISEKEMQVLRWVADGYTNAEIANLLRVSVRTIETRRKRLLEKTRQKNTAALIRHAVKSGLID